MRSPDLYTRLHEGFERRERLAAAAPAMLIMLAEMEGYLAGVESSESEGVLLARLRDTIAKAKGE